MDGHVCRVWLYRASHFFYWGKRATYISIVYNQKIGVLLSAASSHNLPVVAAHIQ